MSSPSSSFASSSPLLPHTGGEEGRRCAPMDSPPRQLMACDRLVSVPDSMIYDVLAVPIEADMRAEGTPIDQMHTSSSAVLLSSSSSLTHTPAAPLPLTTDGVPILHPVSIVSFQPPPRPPSHPFHPDAFGQVHVQHRPDTTTKLLLAMFVFAAAGVPCCLIRFCRSLDLSFDDRNQLMTYRAWPGYCSCCASDEVQVPYSEIANVALTEAGGGGGRHAALYRVYILTRNANRYECLPYPKTIRVVKEYALGSDTDATQHRTGMEETLEILTTLYCASFVFLLFSFVCLSVCIIFCSVVQIPIILRPKLNNSFCRRDLNMRPVSSFCLCFPFSD